MAPGSNSAAPVWKKILRFFGVLAFWLLLWQGISLWVNQELLVPSPWKVVQTLRRLVGQEEFWLSILLSLLRVLEGFLMGVALGTILAVVTSASSAARALLSPLLGILRATPVASFIILALVWIQTNRLPGFISMLMVAPVVWTNVGKRNPADGQAAAGDGKGVPDEPEPKPFSNQDSFGGPLFLGRLHHRTGAGLEVRDCRGGDLPSRFLYRKEFAGRQGVFGDAGGLAWTLMVIFLSLSLEKLLVGTIQAWNRKKRPGETGSVSGKI